jgi:ribosome-binding factor A
MGVRHLPELAFHIDRSEKINARMDSLLTRMKKRQSRRSSGNGARPA